jgi:hypothetical protein
VQASAGEMAFIGGGVMEATGCPLQEYSAIADEHGMVSELELLQHQAGCTREQR